MAGNLRTVPIDSIRKSKSQLREVDKKSAKYQEMLASLSEPAGLMNPISVREEVNPETQEVMLILVDGAHRHTACKEFGMTEIDVKVLDISEAEAVYAQIIGNAAKVETKPYQYAKQLVRALDYDPKASIAKLAEKSKLSPEYVRRLLKLDGLAEPIGKRVDRHELDLVSAMAIADLPGAIQEEWAERAMVAENATKFCAELATFNKQRKAAERAGKTITEAVFEPEPQLRKATEIRPLLEDVDGAQIKAIVGKAKNAIEAGKAMLEWVLKMDPTTVEERRAKFEALQLQRKEQTEKNKEASKARMIENKQKKLEELQKELAEAKAAAAAAAAQA